MRQTGGIPETGCESGSSQMYRQPVSAVGTTYEKERGTLRVKICLYYVFANIANHEKVVLHHIDSQVQN